MRLAQTWIEKSSSVSEVLQAEKLATCLCIFHAFIPQIFISHFLRARHRARPPGHSDSETPSLSSQCGDRGGGADAAHVIRAVGHLGLSWADSVLVVAPCPGRPGFVLALNKAHRFQKGALPALSLHLRSGHSETLGAHLQAWGKEGS